MIEKKKIHTFIFLLANGARSKKKTWFFFQLLLSLCLALSRFSAASATLGALLVPSVWLQKQAETCLRKKKETMIQAIDACARRGAQRRRRRRQQQQRRPCGTGRGDPARGRCAGRSSDGSRSGIGVGGRRRSRRAASASPLQGSRAPPVS